MIKTNKKLITVQLLSCNCSREASCRKKTWLLLSRVLHASPMPLQFDIRT